MSAVHLLKYFITVRRISDDMVVFTGSTGLVAIRLRNEKRPVRLPEEFLGKITV